MKTTKLILVEGGQAVLLPDEFQFTNTDVVSVRRDPDTGDIVISSKLGSWSDFDSLRNRHEVPGDFMAEREQGVEARDPFEGLEGDDHFGAEK